MRIAGACGIAAIVVAGCAESLAILYSPGNFSYTQNWLSDLSGTSYTAFLNVTRPSVSSPTTLALAQWGLTAAGILGTIFAIGLYYNGSSPLYRLGAAFGVMGTVALCSTGFFPAPVGVIHLVAFYAFGLLAPTAMLLIGGALVSSEKWLAGFLITLGIVALVGISTTSFGRAVPELLILGAVALWAIVFSLKMLKTP
jgi:hypothetical membrane protein